MDWAGMQPLSQDMSGMNAAADKAKPTGTWKADDDAPGTLQRQIPADTSAGSVPFTQSTCSAFVMPCTAAAIYPPTATAACD